MRVQTIAKYVAAAWITSMSLATLTHAQEVPPAKCATDVPKHLDWCSTNHGVNEGASCGFSALTGTGVSLPLNVDRAVLANTWDRTNMMGATKAAWRLGAKDKAVAAAVCCQEHEKTAQRCVASRPDLVRAWLSAHPG